MPVRTMREVPGTGFPVGRDGVAWRLVAKNLTAAPDLSWSRRPMAGHGLFA